MQAFADGNNYAEGARTVTINENGRIELQFNGIMIALREKCVLVIRLIGIHRRKVMRQLNSIFAVFIGPNQRWFLPQWCED